MAFGVGFRVAPGVRLRATRGGPRVSVGPRIARVHLGGGRTAVSTGRGPVTLWSTLGGGGHTSAPQTGPTRERKADEWASVHSYLETLLSAHTAPVTRTVPPTAPTVEPVSRREIRRGLRRQGSSGLTWWQIPQRLTAWSEADRQVDVEVARKTAEAERRAAEAQADADAWWRRLLANDPDTVTEHLERAFADHDMPATVAAVEGDRTHLVIPVLTVEKLIGPREPRLTEAGNLSLARMTKARRHELYEAAICSSMIAVAAETFALAPGTDRIELAVVAPEHLGGPAVLMLAEVSRDLVLPDGADRPVEHDLLAAAEAGRATLVRDKGARIGALRPLDEDDPDVRMLLDVLDT